MLVPMGGRLSVYIIPSVVDGGDNAGGILLVLGSISTSSPTARGFCRSDAVDLKEPFERAFQLSPRAF